MQALASNNIQTRIEGAEEHQRRLANDHSKLRILVLEAEARASEESELLGVRLQRDYPSLSVAPTAMGSVAAWMETYTLSRYGIEWSVAWPRLQKVLLGKDYHRVLQDSKIKLDLMVSCIGLVAVSWVGWLAYSLARGVPLWFFLGIALAVPAMLWALYRLAVVNYRAFANLVASGIDLFRFDLLEELGLPRPEDSAQERAVWGQVNRHLDKGDAVLWHYTSK